MLNKVLITSVGGGLGAELIKKIKKTTKFKGLKIYGTDINDNNPSKYFVDKFFKVPNPKNKKFLDNFIKIVKKNKINLILPGSDDEAIVLCRNRKLFENKKTYLASINFNILKKFITKQSTYEILKSKNLPVAEFDIAKNKKELRDKVLKLKKKDFVIKPSKSIGGRNVSVFRSDIKKILSFNGGKELHYPNNKQNKLEILNNYKNKYPVVITERLFPPTYDIDMLSYEGKLINVVTRKRLNPQVPNDGHDIILSKTIRRIGEKIINEFNLSWLYDCDCMTDANGKVKIIEINPRMSGSLATSLTAGYPLIDNMLRIINKKRVAKVQNFKKKITIVPYKTLFKKI